MRVLFWSRRLARLQLGIGDEARSRLGRLGKAKRAGRHRFDAERSKEVADLAHLALVVAGDHQPAGSELAGHATAFNCASKILAQPIRARRSRRSSSSSLNRTEEHTYELQS